MQLEDEGDQTRRRGWKYPTPPCALAKILPETTVRALLLFQQIFFVLVCIHLGSPRVPPRVFASGPKPCGGNYLHSKVTKHRYVPLLCYLLCSLIGQKQRNVLEVACE